MKAVGLPGSAKMWHRLYPGMIALSGSSAKAWRGRSVKTIPLCTSDIMKELWVE